MIYVKKNPDHYTVIQWTGDNYDDVVAFAVYAGMSHCAVIHNGNFEAYGDPGYSICAREGEWLIARIDGENWEIVDAVPNLDEYEAQH